MTEKANKKRILLIEDNKPIFIAYQKGFSEAGFEIFHIENGQNAVSAIKELKPDIILLDLIMPKRDGFEVLADINAHPELKHIPVIVLTNLEEDFYTKEVEKYNVADYLIKSENSIQEIIKKIDQILARAVDKE